ncbi:MAG: adenylate kinase [Phormidesmis sp.]
MKRVAVFGNAGAGKSTLSKRLAQVTGLPLIALDLLQYDAGGKAVSHEAFKAAHDQVLQQESWIVDGFGSLDTVWVRLDAADTLVYVDMPLLQHYWWVTKRFLKGAFVLPEGWPKGSSILQGTLQSYRTVGLCHQKLTPRYRDYVREAQGTKQVYHLRSTQEIKAFHQAIARQFSQI